LTAKNDPRGFQLWIEQVSSLTGLETLGSLNVLNLRNNQVTNLSPITNLHRLSNLNVGMNRLTNLEALDGFTNLHDLVVSGNPLSPKAITNQIPALRQLGVNVIWP
jgi:Leucine-rich repeat (LRR) protein